MESNYIKHVLREIRDAVVELRAEGINAEYPKQVEIECNGVRIIVPWI
jgi:hypothetical protein